MFRRENESMIFQETGPPITAQDIILATLYSFIVFPGVIGNAVIITIVRKTPSMHTTTNYLLMNLAVADLLTLLFCPGLYDFALTKVRLHGTLGDFICKVFAGNAVVPITINVAVLTVCTIAVERYLALVKPFQTRLRLSKDSVSYVVAILWCVSVLSCIPDIPTNTYDMASTKYPCKRPWSLDEYSLNRPFIIFTSVCFGFICPLFLSLCYFGIIRGLYFTRTIFSENAIATADVRERQSKRQLARLLIWLTVIFTVCSLPFSVYFTVLVFIDPKTVQKNYDTLFILHRFCRFLLFSNSFFNPLLYAMQSSNYREEFRAICNLKFGCIKSSINPANGMASTDNMETAGGKKSAHLPSDNIELKNTGTSQTKSSLI